MQCCQCCMTIFPKNVTILPSATDLTTFRSCQIHRKHTTHIELSYLLAIFPLCIYFLPLSPRKFHQPMLIPTFSHDKDPAYRILFVVLLCIVRTCAVAPYSNDYRGRWPIAGFYHDHAPGQPGLHVVWHTRWIEPIWWIQHSAVQLPAVRSLFADRLGIYHPDYGKPWRPLMDRNGWGIIYFRSRNGAFF